MGFRDVAFKFYAVHRVGKKSQPKVRGIAAQETF